MWRLVASGVFGLLAFMAQVGPDEAVSNLSKWVGKVASPPSWLTAPSWDTGATITFTIVALSLLAWYVIERRHRKAMVGVQASGEMETSGTPLVPKPNMKLEDVVKRITGRPLLPLPIEEGSVDLIYACNRIREKALNGEIVVFGCAEWRSTEPRDFDHMVKGRIPAEYWNDHKIDAADSFGTDPVLRRGITSRLEGGWDKTEYLDLWLDRSQVEAAWPKGAA